VYRKAINRPPILEEPPMRWKTACAVVLCSVPLVMGQTDPDDPATTPAETAPEAPAASEPPPPVSIPLQAGDVALINTQAAKLWAGWPTDLPNGVASPLIYARQAQLNDSAAKADAPAGLTKSIRFLTARADSEIPAQLQIYTALWKTAMPDAVVAGNLKALGIEPLKTNLHQRNPTADDLNTWLGLKIRHSHWNKVTGLQIPPVATAVFTDVVEMRAPWFIGFPADATKAESFTTTKDGKVDVPIMHLALNLPYLKSAEVEMIGLPLAPQEGLDKAATYMLVIMLPPSGNDLAPLRKAATAEKFKTWLAAAVVPPEKLTAWENASPTTDDKATREKWIETYPVKAVAVSLPRFSISSRPPAAIDTGNTLLVQASSIKVDESGVNAGDESPHVDSGGMIGKPVPFNANRPFLFAVVESETGAIVLQGQVENPVAEK
jgi:hypothetical protein